MRQFDKDNDEYYFECDNQFKGCGEAKYEVNGRELCIDCAFDELFQASKGEEFLFNGDYKNDMAVLSYFFDREEIVSILRREAEKLKDSVTGYITYAENLKNCIEDNWQKSEYLDFVDAIRIEES